MASYVKFPELRFARTIGSHTQVADISSAVTITPASGANWVVLQPLAQAIRITLDGTAPTTDKGFVIAAGDIVLINIAGTGTSLKVIEDAATASLEYQFYE